MAIPAGVTHVTFGGGLPGGEVWESGFWISGDTPTSNAAATALAELILGNMVTMDASGVWHTMGNLISTQVNLVYAKAYC